MAAPSADETPEDQRRQNGQGKKDEPGVDRTALNRQTGPGGSWDLFANLQLSIFAAGLHKFPGLPEESYR